MHQRWTEHRYTFATVKFELFAIQPIVWSFLPIGLHNFLWRTSLGKREVLKNVFSTSFGGTKVVMEAQFLQVGVAILDCWGVLATNFKFNSIVQQFQIARGQSRVSTDLGVHIIHGF